MAAGGYREFLAGETLDEDAINDYLMQGVLVFAGTAARGSAIGTPVEGQFSFRTDDDVVEFYDGSSWVELETGPKLMSAFIIGGGGGGGGCPTASRPGGGGGGGGAFANFTGNNSGDGNSAAPKIPVAPGDSFTVSVGAGGAGGSSATGVTGARGGSSRVGSIFVMGGGGGGRAGGEPAIFGGSGGGGGDAGGELGLGIDGQGGNGSNGGSNGDGGTGGGAGGNAASSTSPGAGLATTITGSSVTRGEGGNQSNVAGGTNTGDGGDSRTSVGTGAAGGSGIVIIRFPSSLGTPTIGGGLTSSSTTVGDDTVITFTAGTDTVTF